MYNMDMRNFNALDKNIPMAVLLASAALALSGCAKPNEATPAPTVQKTQYVEPNLENSIAGYPDESHQVQHLPETP